MDAGLTLREWLLVHFTPLRGLLLACSLGWWVVLLGWIAPTPAELRRAALAAWFQFWAGIAFDALLVRAGAWHYREVAGTWLGVPLDLHVSWTLLWSFGCTGLARRIFPGDRGDEAAAGIARRAPPVPSRTGSRRAVATYLAAWIVLTASFDAAIARFGLFLDRVAWWWWLADFGFLATTLAATLWLERSIGRGPGARLDLARLPAAPPLVRALAWSAGFLALFFVMIPPTIDRLTSDIAAQFGARWPAPLVAALGAGAPASTAWNAAACGLAATGLALGGAALVALARVGGGTPIPWDPPPRLVLGGLYGRLANPIQVAGVLLGAATFCARPTWPRALYVADLLLVAMVVFRNYERVELARRFGAAGTAYLANVRAWWPRRAPRRHALQSISSSTPPTISADAAMRRRETRSCSR